MVYGPSSTCSATVSFCNPPRSSSLIVNLVFNPILHHTYDINTKFNKCILEYGLVNITLKILSEKNLTFTHKTYTCKQYAKQENQLINC